MRLTSIWDKEKYFGTPDTVPNAHPLLSFSLAPIKPTSMKGALIELEGRFRGKFYDLEEVPNEQLPAFDPPSTTSFNLDPLLDGAFARDWPNGRTLWCCQEGSLSVLLHGRNHVTVTSTTSSATSSGKICIRNPFVKGGCCCCCCRRCCRHRRRRRCCSCC